MLLNAIDEEVYIDIGCGVTLADKAWLLALLPKVDIRIISKALRVKGLGTAMYNTNKYILILIYIPTTKEDGTLVLYRIIREIYLVSNLKVYILIGNNIIRLE